MENTSLVMGMRLHAAQQALKDTGRKALVRMQDENGEVGSWLIFAALIAAAAAIAGGVIAGWFQDKANAVAQN